MVEQQKTAKRVGHLVKTNKNKKQTNKKKTLSKRGVTGYKVGQYHEKGVIGYKVAQNEGLLTGTS